MRRVIELQLKTGEIIHLQASFYPLGDHGPVCDTEAASVKVLGILSFIPSDLLVKPPAMVSK